MRAEQHVSLSNTVNGKNNLFPYSKEQFGYYLCGLLEGSIEVSSQEEEKAKAELIIVGCFYRSRKRH